MNWVVGVQIATFLALACLFVKTGDWRLGIAQGSYAVATLVLFTK